VNGWIVNASPRILLGKVKRLELLRSLTSSILIPHSVSLEILAGPEDDPAKQWLQTEGGSACIVPDAPPLPEILAWDLGSGETSVISMSLAKERMVCVLDDLAARNCAKVFAIPVLGTLGILLKAKSSGLISALRPEIDNLVASGSMLSDKIIVEALHLANEST
jgi:predicted nucleic acid-binding protein